MKGLFRLSSRKRFGVVKTGQTIIYVTGDDGDYQKGLDFDFKDNGDGTITDNNTGLMWAKDGTGAGCNNGATITWADGIAWAEALNFAGYTDWRLPNMKELFTLVNYQMASSPFIDQTYFINTVSNIYWTSTTYRKNTAFAVCVRFDIGSVYFYRKTDPYYIKPVRGGL